MGRNPVFPAVWALRSKEPTHLPATNPTSCVLLFLSPPLPGLSESGDSQFIQGKPCHNPKGTVWFQGPSDRNHTVAGPQYVPRYLSISLKQTKNPYFFLKFQWFHSVLSFYLSKIQNTTWYSATYSYLITYVEEYWGRISKQMHINKCVWIWPLSLRLKATVTWAAHSLLQQSWRLLSLSAACNDISLPISWTPTASRYFGNRWKSLSLFVHTIGHPSINSLPSWIILCFTSAHVFTQAPAGACFEGPALSKDHQFETTRFVPIAYLWRWARPSVPVPQTLGGKK